MKVVDCFLFYNEFDVLEVRLNTLDPLVDYFVLTESNRMFSGLPKPLYFEEHRHEERFKKFEHKIIHQIITDIPDDYVNLSPDSYFDPVVKHVVKQTLSGDWWPHNHAPYGRDTFSKESLIRPLFYLCKDSDIVLLSDVDEIPNPDTLKQVIDTFNPNEVYNLRMKMYNHYFNCQKFDCPDENWIGTIALTFENFKQFPFCLLRTRRRGIMVENGGWHFSFMGGREGSLIKMISGNENSLYTDQAKNSIQDNIDHCLEYGHDVFFRPCRFALTPIENQYILDNLERFREHIK